MRQRVISVFVLLLLVCGILLSLNYFEGSLSHAGNNKTSAGAYHIDDVPPMYDQKNNPIWDRENAFINNNIYYIQGRGPDIRTYRQKEGLVSQEAIRVVLIGDSYVWGNGAYDPGMSIGRRLERELNKATSPNTFNVIVEAKNGDSTFNYVDIYTKEKIKELDPDIIIYGFFQNDLVPSFTEKMICGEKSACKDYSPETMPEYRNCVEAKSGLFSHLVKKLVRSNFPSLASELMIRHCDTVYQRLKEGSYDVLTLMRYPNQNPWLPKWKEAVKILASQASGTPLAVANLKTRYGISDEAMSIITREFSKNNYGIVPMSSTAELISSTRDDELNVNPANGHSGSELTHSYASDIAKYILAIFPQSGKKTNHLSLPTDSNLLINSKLPNSISLTSNKSQSADFELGKPFIDSRYPFAIAGEVVKPQYVACAYLGYSHVIINLDSEIQNNTRYKLKTPKNDGGVLYLSLAYYDANYKMIIKKIGNIGSGIEFTIPRSSNGVSLLIGDPKRNIGCSMDESINMDYFSASLERV